MSIRREALTTSERREAAMRLQMNVMTLIADAEQLQGELGRLIIELQLLEEQEHRANAASTVRISPEDLQKALRGDPPAI